MFLRRWCKFNLCYLSGNKENKSSPVPNIAKTSIGNDWLKIIEIASYHNKWFSEIIYKYLSVFLIQSILSISDDIGYCWQHHGCRSAESWSFKSALWNYFKILHIFRWKKYCFSSCHIYTKEYSNLCKNITMKQWPTSNKH